MYSIFFNVDKMRNSILSPLIVVAHSALSEHASYLQVESSCMNTKIRFTFILKNRFIQKTYVKYSPNDTQLLFVSFMCCSKSLVWSMVIVAVDLHKQSIQLRLEILILILGYKYSTSISNI